MKRAMSKTPATYMNSCWTYRKGPIENVSFDSSLKNAYQQLAPVSRRNAEYNAIVLQRKLRIASQQPLVPILRKRQPSFTNNPHS